MNKKYKILKYFSLKNYVNYVPITTPIIPPNAYVEKYREHPNSEF